MKQVLKIAVAAALLMIGGVASAQVLNSPHDLTSAPGVTTTETCVFCHTPHGADIAAPVPLWNKTLPAGTGYQTYATLNTSTLDGSEHAEVGSVSLACLSCHDGVQAVDAVLNAPGRGPGTGNLGSGSQIGDAPVNPLAVIGIDLRNDHPISIQYGGGGVNATSHSTDGPFTGDTVDPDFIDPVRATINTNPAWWVDVDLGLNSTAGVREKTDMILYTRADPALDGGVDQPFVECGSCHDPHNSQTGVDPTASVAFLRVLNTDSQICTTCHIK
jgi:hypothetical protein